MLFASRMGKRYQPGARGGCAESAFGKKINIKNWLQCDLRWSYWDFINYDSNNLIPSLHFPAHGNLAPHSISYFLKLHLKRWQFSEVICFLHSNIHILFKSLHFFLFLLCFLLLHMSLFCVILVWSLKGRNIIVINSRNIVSNTVL